MKGVKASELVVSLEDKTGALGEVTSLLKKENINIRAVSGWVEEGKAVIRLISADNLKAKEILSSGFSVEEKEVVVLEVPDEPGQLDALSCRLKEAGINMTHLYGTVSGGGQLATLVFASTNNDQAIEIIGE